MSNFQKRHYEILAKLIGESRNLLEFVEKLQIALKEDNPRFDYERFDNAIIAIRPPLTEDEILRKEIADSNEYNDSLPSRLSQTSYEVNFLKLGHK